MEATYQTQAIILKRAAANESDIRVIVYSCDRGKLELLARGARKLKSKLAGHLEPITLSGLMVVRGRKFDYAGAAISENCFINIKADYEKILYAGKVISIFDNLIKLEEKDEYVFKLLLDILNIINNNKKPIANYDLILALFVLQLLIKLGHKPELHHCVICGKKIEPKENKFDFLKGGLVCGACKPSEDKYNRPISEECIKILRLVENTALLKLTNLKSDKKLDQEVIDIMEKYLKMI